MDQIIIARLPSCLGSGYISVIAIKLISVFCSFRRPMPSASAPACPRFSAMNPLSMEECTQPKHPPTLSSIFFLLAEGPNWQVQVCSLSFILQARCIS